MGRKKELQQSPGQKREIKKALTTLRKREREAGREEGLMCVYHSLSVFNETVVWFWRQLKLTEALMF